MAGFQLWVNLAGKDKLTAPTYRDVPPADVPVFTLESGVSVRVIAGESHGVAGAVTRPTTEPLYLDIALPAGAAFEQAVPATHNAFIYVHGGAVEVEGMRVDSERMAILVNDTAADGVRIRALDGDAKLLLIAGQPLNEPIAQYGPFVMNTQQEIFQAVKDFQSGVLAT